jgi:glucose/arabinose dehydrogenase
MGNLRLRGALAAGAVIAVAVTGCSSGGSGHSGGSGGRPTRPARAVPALAPTGTPREVAVELGSPWSVVFVHGTPLVSERDTGHILELDRAGRTRVVGTIRGVVHEGEAGVLGLAVDRRSRLYVYSTGPRGNRIERYELTGTPGSLALGAHRTILDGLPAADHHDGGRIAFGPDGMLYAGVGDAGRSADAQNPRSLSGKILRMTEDGGVPADNPFPGSLVYSYGHRNVQGLAWGGDGTMYATEFGQDTWDELNVIKPGGNYGWPTVEGIVSGHGRFVNPVQQWRPEDASPSDLLAVGTTLFVADLRGEVLRTVPMADLSASADFYHGTYGRIRALAAAPDGTLWFVTDNTDGRGRPGPHDDRVLSVRLTPATLG